MKERQLGAAVIGGGAAGMAAALSLKQSGVDVVIIEREAALGGILGQCIHNGFGLHYFKEELTGPEFAERLNVRVEEAGIETYTNMTVMDIQDYGRHKTLVGYSCCHGLVMFSVKAIVFAMGCRERNRGNIGLPGTRPSGIFTAGLAQRLVNIEGIVPGKRAVIVGSGDIGLIMARRMTWIGAEVPAVVEIQPYPSGLTRNIVQCLNDFNIPLHLSHVISQIHGKDRVSGVDIAPFEDGITKTEDAFHVDCDTLLLSVGLVPDTELPKKLNIRINRETGGPLVDANLMTSVPGVFACGNVLHVHDLVDFVAQESERCGRFVADYITQAYDYRERDCQRGIVSGANVKYVVPGTLHTERKNTCYLRPLIVKNKAVLQVSYNGRVLMEKKLQHVQPSEMISFDCDSSLWSQNPDAESEFEVSIL